MPIPISRKYQPDPETVALLRDRGITEEFIDDYLPEFVKFWADTGKRKQSWHAVFLRQCAEHYDYTTGQRH